MDSIRVYINDTEVGYYKIEDTGVTFTWQAKLIGEINSFSTTTTKTIALPLTNTLKILLKSPEVIDTTNSLSNREYFTIDIYWNDTVAIQGYIKLQKVVILENDEYIEFTVEPREKNWITQFKDFKLTELDFTISPDQTHALTYANIVTSETYLPLTREYVYAPIDIGEVGRLQVLWVEQSGADTYYYYLGKQVVAAVSTFSANTYGFTETQLTRYGEVFTETADAFWNARGIYKAKTSTPIAALATFNQTGFMYVLTTYYWEVSDFSPSIRHNAIIRRCFSRIGYAVTIIDSSSYFNDKYNFCHNVKVINEFEKTRNKLKVRVQAGGFAYTKTAAQTWRVPFRNITGDGLITSANFTDTNSNNSANIDAGTNVSKYTVTETCILWFKWDYAFRHSLTTPVTVATTGIDIKLHIRQYDSGNTLRRTVTIDITMDWSNYSFVDYSGTMQSIFYMETGDYVDCSIEYMDLWAGGATITIYDSNFLSTEYYDWGNYKNKTIRLNEYLPERTAYDYIKDLSFINNWEFYTNEKLKQVYIVREDYKRTGKQIDFTQKLNRAKAVELEEIGIQWPKKIYFNWLKDEEDWSIKLVEQVKKASLGTTYNENELEMASRFGVGLITNLNVFTSEVQELTNDIYAASLDKFDTSNRINFNTIQMSGEETWPHAPTWKRIDYQPRYLTITFATVLETSGVGGVTSVVYSIENNTNHTTYPWASFLEFLHYGTDNGLLLSKYAKRIRAIKYGWILRGYFDINENDVNTFVETYEDNNFRGDYQLQLKGITKIGELLKVNDFSPATFNQTQIEFVIFRDDL